MKVQRILFLATLPALSACRSMKESIAKIKAGAEAWSVK